MQPYGWIYFDDKRNVWLHKCWDGGRAIVLGEYPTKGDAIRAQLGIR